MEIQVRPQTDVIGAHPFRAVEAGGTIKKSNVRFPLLACKMYRTATAMYEIAAVLC